MKKDSVFPYAIPDEPFLPAGWFSPPATEGFVAAHKPNADRTVAVASGAWVVDGRTVKAHDALRVFDGGPRNGRFSRVADVRRDLLVMTDNTVVQRHEVDSLRWPDAADWILLNIENAPPAHKLNADRTVAVATDVFFNEDMTTCPVGVKVQLLGAGGVASYGTYNGRDDFWIGWAPVPKRRIKS